MDAASISYFLLWLGVEVNVVDPPGLCQDHSKAQSIAKSEQSLSNLVIGPGGWGGGGGGGNEL